MFLERIRQPGDLRTLDHDQLRDLADEIREFIVSAVSEVGGHLGSNLGAVELTLALHRVFESPLDAILWDTGHQAYVHKIVTGRQGLRCPLRTPCSRFLIYLVQSAHLGRKDLPGHCKWLIADR